jgi:glycosyltransferase involved in cell wall biosynthesis
MRKFPSDEVRNFSKPVVVSEPGEDPDKGSMKILYITNGYPPHRWAGTETYTAGLAKAFHRRRHAVQVLCAGEWAKGPRYWNDYSDDTCGGIPVRRIHVNWQRASDPFRYLYDNPVVAEFLVKYLKQLRPDLVHVTSCETLSASVLRIVREMELPLILSLTDFWFLCPRINLLSSDDSNCTGQTSAWECLRCQLLGAKIYRWPRRLFPEPVVAQFISKISRYPLLTRRRGLRGMAGEMGKRKKFLRAALDWPDRLITASSFVRKVYRANGISAPIRVQPYGHDLGWLRNYHGKTASNVVRIGFIGQIIPSKGVHLLLQAARSLRAKVGDKFKLRIYGNLKKTHGYGSSVQLLASGMPNVKFAGTYPHEESASVFAGIDILVVPSLWFDFPLVVQEAFATATPVVASNLGGMAEAVAHETNGLLFEAGNSQDLARQLRRVITEPGLIEELRAGVPRVKTIAEETSELERTYRELAAV